MQLAAPEVSDLSSEPDHVHELYGTKDANPLKAAKIVSIDYKDAALLRKFISDRGKIRARRVTGNCTQHQRDIAMAIKNSREMALLPYSTAGR